jgi:hypothetical protein
MEPWNPNARGTTRTLLEDATSTRCCIRLRFADDAITQHVASEATTKMEAPKPDSRADGFRRAWNYVVAPPCVLHGTPLAPNAGDFQIKCVPNGGFGTISRIGMFPKREWKINYIFNTIF